MGDSMKKINYIYYIILIVMMCAMIIFMKEIIMTIGLGYMIISPLYVLYFLFSQNIIYAVVKKKGVKDNFCITHQYKFEWSMFWIDAQHNELACLCMFNPFKVQYVSMSHVHDADIKVRYFSHKEYISYLSFRLYVDGRRHSFRIKTSGRYQRAWIGTDTYGKELIQEVQEFADILNKRRKSI